MRLLSGRGRCCRSYRALSRSRPSDHWDSRIDRYGKRAGPEYSQLCPAAHAMPPRDDRHPPGFVFAPPPPPVFVFAAPAPPVPTAPPDPLHPAVLGPPLPPASSNRAPPEPPPAPETDPASNSPDPWPASTPALGVPEQLKSKKETAACRAGIRVMLCISAPIAETGNPFARYHADRFGEHLQLPKSLRGGALTPNILHESTDHAWSIRSPLFRMFSSTTV